MMISFTLFPFKPPELPHPELAQLLLPLNGTSPGGREPCWAGDRGQGTALGGRIRVMKALLRKSGLPLVSLAEKRTAEPVTPAPQTIQIATPF